MENLSKEVALNAKPLVTIITSCYNAEKYLDDYFQGLLSQTYENIQLILFDDGSSDRSWEKICTYEAALKKKFTEVICERHENIGAKAEFLLAWGRTRGDFFCLLESDDYYLPRKVEENVRYFQDHPDVGAVHSDTDYIYGDRVEHYHWATQGVKISVGDIFESLLVGNFIMTCSFSCRTDLFRKFVNYQEYISRGYLAMDYAIFLGLSRHTRFGYIDESLARYRVVPGSLSHPTDPRRLFSLQKSCYLMKLDFVEKYPVSDSIRQLVYRQFYEFQFLNGFRGCRKRECLEGYYWLLELIGERKKVLEVGPGGGHMTEALSKRGCRVTSIEIDPQLSKEAKPFCEELFVGDIEQLDLDNKLDHKSFDVILLGDVLEHLKDPSEVLRRLHKFLKPSGYLVVSLPNVAHASVRLALLDGEFPYGEEGLLDKTHLRFFTLRTITTLFRETGYEICDLRRVRLGFFDTEIPVDPVKTPLTVLRRLLQDPEVTTYQYVFRALKRESQADPGSSSGMEELSHPAWRPRRERNRLATEYRRRGITFYRYNRLSEARSMLCRSLLLKVRAKTLMYLLASCLGLKGLRWGE